MSPGKERSWTTLEKKSEGIYREMQIADELGSIKPVLSICYEEYN